MMGLCKETKSQPEVETTDPTTQSAREQAAEARKDKAVDNAHENNSKNWCRLKPLLEEPTAS